MCLWLTYLFVHLALQRCYHVCSLSPHFHLLNSFKFMSKVQSVFIFVTVYGKKGQKMKGQVFLDQSRISNTDRTTSCFGILPQERSVLQPGWLPQCIWCQQIDLAGLSGLVFIRQKLDHIMACLKWQTSLWDLFISIPFILLFISLYLPSCLLYQPLLSRLFLHHASSWASPLRSLHWSPCATCEGISNWLPALSPLHVCVVELKNLITALFQCF